MKFSALLLLILLVAGPAAAGTLRVGTVGDYPPFNYLDEESRLTGFDIDIARALCDEMEVECHFIQEKWAELIISLRAGKFDAIAASMSITERRKRVVSFTDHYYRNASRFVTSKGSDFDPKRPEGRTFGAMRATIASDWLEENVAGIATVRLYRGQTELLQALVNARVDAIFGDALGLHAWLDSRDGATFRFAGEGIHLDEGIGIAVRHEDEVLRLRLNGALQALFTSGIYRQINARYFPFSIY
ncbi:MAG: transporter substrate-binding domain-containing protein [Deltaproteobacteria bacterium]|nr:transporter substrate-binding domain-containing protein [Deltaproteobacteria bacterium]